MNTEYGSKDYNDSLDRTASDIRTELANRIREAVNSNQECFIAKWLTQNPDVDITNVILCHGFKDNAYTFWIEENSKVYTGTGSDYLDCVLGVGGFEKYGPIKEKKQNEQQ